MRKESLKRNSYEGGNESGSDSDDFDEAAGRQNNSNGNGGSDPFDALVGNSILAPAFAADTNNISSDNDAAWLGGEATSKTNGKLDEEDEEEQTTANETDDAGDGDAADTAADTADEETAGTHSNADGDYEVESIVDHKYSGKRKKLYLIRWKGYTADQDTWEPEKSLCCPELIAQYLEIHPDTRPPKKEPKPPKPKKERPPGLPARDMPKRERNKNPIIETDDAEQKKPKKHKKKKAKKTEFEVEKIIDDRTDRGATVYRIRWKGYSPQEDTWEPADSLTCDSLVARYWAKKSNVEYEVERICGHKVEGSQTFYYVKWKGYNVSENTWEPEKTVSCPELIDEYVKKHFNVRLAAPKPILTKGAKKSVESSKRSKSSKASKSPKSAKKRKVETESESEIESEKDDATEEDNDDEEDDDDENRDPLAIDDKEWEVEAILDERVMKGNKEFRIHWKGCPSSQDTWEPVDQLNCSDLISKFERKRRAEKKTGGTPNKAGKRVSIKLPTTRKSSRRS